MGEPFDFVVFIGRRLHKVNLISLYSYAMNNAVGILDPDAKNLNPLTGREYTNPAEYRELSQKWREFPVYEARKEFIKKIQENQVILVTAGTGSGKTVLVPKYALHAYKYNAKIAITNPKKTPTESAAKFSAKTLDVELGKQVGYRFKGTKRVSNDTKLTYTTDGYITAKLMGDDPLLSKYDCLIIDEAHERNTQIDFMFLYIRRALLQRPTLKLIIMSATIDTQKFVDYFPAKYFKFVHLEAPGKPYRKIEEFFISQPINKFDKNGILTNQDYIEHAVRQVSEIIRSDRPGNILVFLTSSTDGRQACKLLKQKLPENYRPFCVELHSGTKPELQEYITGNRNYRSRNNGPWDRKVIMSTEVAESSITISDGITFVIDTGLALQENYYPEIDMEGLERRYISKASHQQRKGRTGRLADGYCYNIFTKEEYEKQFPEYTNPPMLKTDLFEPIFKMMTSTVYTSSAPYPFKYAGANQDSKTNKNTQLTEVQVRKIRSKETMALDEILSELLDRPKASFVNTALRSLTIIEILEKTNASTSTLVLSEIGKRVSELRMSPQWGRVLLEALKYDKNTKDDVLRIVGMVEASQDSLDTFFYIPSEGDFKANPKKYKETFNKYEKIRKRLTSGEGDHWTMLNIYSVFDNKKQELFRKYESQPASVKLKKVFDELRLWSEKYFLRYNVLNRINQDYLKEYRERLDELQHPRRNKPNKQSNKQLNKKENETNKQGGGDEHKQSVLKCLYSGLKYHVARNVSKDTFKVTTAPKSSVAKLDRDSSIKKVAKQTPVIYNRYFNQKLVISTKLK